MIDHQIIADATSERIKAMILTQGDLAPEAGHVADILWNQSFTRGLLGAELHSELATPLLKKYAAALQHQLRNLLHNHSWYYWSHLGRRLGPGVSKGEGHVDGALNYMTFQLACLKFGQDGSSDMYLRDQEARPISLTEADFRSLMLTFYLSCYLAKSYATLRTVQKGASLIPGRNRRYRLEGTQEFWELVRLYDRRRFSSDQGLVFSTSGLATNSDASFSYGGHRVLAPFVNASQIKYRLPDVTLPNGDTVEAENEADFNFLPGSLDLQDFERAAQLFDEGIRSRWGVTAHEVVSTLEAVSLLAYHGMMSDIQVQYAVVQRGWYLMAKTPETIETIAESYVELHPEDGLGVSEVVEVVDRVLACLGNSRGRDIDLCLKAPLPLLRETPWGLIFDLWLTPHFLNHLIASLPWEVMGEQSNRRGRLFEESVKATLDSAGLEVWQCPLVLKTMTGTERNLDIGVIQGSTLFLVECRSAVVPQTLERGESGEVHSRIERVVKCKLDQSDSLRKLLALNPVGRNYALPQKVKRLVSVACSPHPEFLPERDDYYFLSDGTPRFVTPAELVSLVNSFHPAEHIGRPYCSVVDR